MHAALILLYAVAAGVVYIYNNGCSVEMKDLSFLLPPLHISLILLFFLSFLMTTPEKILRLSPPSTPLLLLFFDSIFHIFRARFWVLRAVTQDEIWRRKEVPRNIIILWTSLPICCWLMPALGFVDSPFFHVAFCWCFFILFLFIKRAAWMRGNPISRQWFFFLLWDHANFSR